MRAVDGGRAGRPSTRGVRGSEVFRFESLFGRTPQAPLAGAGPPRLGRPAPHRPRLAAELGAVGAAHAPAVLPAVARLRDRKSTRLNSSHVAISYAVFCLKKKKKNKTRRIVKKKTKKTKDN